ncbi:hypothetical protein GOP47_0024014 [Adiantum capillus-veneris]|uniref:U3 small nucleolar ribonucleoprotein protein MPP10 n=1 Tax=Adiantum capillus-veneris TaxID=13818 RepID=A0A9D4Z501_ADICA|nr:hypothetical protein GOP47_0024014 [Adiantum capillus-veneris]
MATRGEEQDGKSALVLIENSDPVVWLADHVHLSHQTRTALEYLYSLAKEYASQCPLPHLLTLNFDCEQIWQQIDLQSAPLLSAARQRLKHLQRIANSVELLDGRPKFPQKGQEAVSSQNEPEDQEENAELDDQGEQEEEDSYGGSSGKSESEEDGEEHAVEDKFFKLKDMEKFIDDAEAHQDLAADLSYETNALESNEDESEYEDGDTELDYKHDEDAVGTENVKYEDFFGGGVKRKLTNTTSNEMSQLEPLTAHEKNLAKVEKRIKELENANLNSTLWTMQGEVSAVKRPKNSALEVELDFEHNVRPPPVITEEVTASLEDLIRTRIAENKFDDVQRKPSVPLNVPKEQMEVDEKKSQKGLAELYEDDFMQKTGLGPLSSTPADEIRKEATRIFKAVCVKLDALSHFHFTPKPVIEDMAVRTDVPALAMEEVAPLMVSDAQMLAPEEHFTGEEVMKADAELSREERKRRRARKKEKARVAKRKESYKKPSILTLQTTNPQGASDFAKRRKEQSHYSKSNQVFEQLDETNKKGKKVVAESLDLRASFLKL